MIRGLIAVVAVALALSACGGESDPKTSEDKATASPTPALLTIEQACAQVQLVNENVGSVGQWAPPEYGDYGDQIADFASESVPEIAGPLTGLADKAQTVRESIDTDHDAAMLAASQWRDAYAEVASICMRTDSPIERIN